MRAPTTAKLLVRLRAVPKFRAVPAKELGGLLCVAGIRVCAAHKFIRVAVDDEVAVAHLRTLGGDVDIIAAGADTLSPGDVVVDTTCLDLVADGDGGVDSGGEGRGEEYDERVCELHIVRGVS